MGNAQTGGLFLPLGVRDAAGGLSRSGDRHARPRFLAGGAGQDPAGVHDARWSPSIRWPQHVRLHGDGVRDIALWVDDADAAFRETTGRGAGSVREPETLRDEDGEVRISAIATYGDTIHTFVERRNYAASFCQASCR